MLILFMDLLHDIRHTALDLFLNTPDTFILIISQIEARIQRISAASIYFDHLFGRKKLLLRDQAGAGGEVLFCSFVVFHEVVAMG